jgi:hypothetical protein
MSTDPMGWLYGHWCCDCDVIDDVDCCQVVPHGHSLVMFALAM